MAATIRLQVSDRSRGTGRRKTDSLTYPHKKRSGDLDGQRSTAESSATVAAFFTQPAPLAAIDETKRPQQAQTHWRASLPTCGSHVEVLAAIL